MIIICNVSAVKREISMNNNAKRRLFVFVCIIAFNVAAWFSRSFSDWYTDHIFPFWGKTLGRLTSLAPFSVGEWAIVAGLLWLAILLLRFLIALPSFLTGNRDRYRACLGNMPGQTVDLLLGIAVVMSLNCFVLYHTTPIDPEAGNRVYSQTELAALRDMIVTECNTRSVIVNRDADGNVLPEGKMEEEAREAIDALGSRLFPRLAGYSVRPKTFFFSDFISQQYMMGYYFPFTMEANINGRMEIMNKPFGMCHELAHTHGYLYEDEANLLGFLACLSSDDPAFVYSGYLGVLGYVDNDFYDSAGEDEYDRHPQITDLVRRDARFLSDESWEAVEKDALLDTETVRQAAETFIDQNQKLNGISAGRAVYSHVVALLLSYYAGDAPYVR